MALNAQRYKNTLSYACPVCGRQTQTQYVVGNKTRFKHETKLKNAKTGTFKSLWKKTTYCEKET